MPNIAIAENIRLRDTTRITSEQTLVDIDADLPSEISAHASTRQMNGSHMRGTNRASNMGNVIAPYEAAQLRHSSLSTLSDSLPF